MLCITWWSRNPCSTLTQPIKQILIQLRTDVACLSNSSAFISRWLVDVSPSSLTSRSTCALSTIYRQCRTAFPRGLVTRPNTPVTNRYRPTALSNSVALLAPASRPCTLTLVRGPGNLLHPLYRISAAVRNMDAGKLNQIGFFHVRVTSISSMYIFSFYRPHGTDETTCDTVRIVAGWEFRRLSVGRCSPLSHSEAPEASRGHTRGPPPLDQRDYTRPPAKAYWRPILASTAESSQALLSSNHVFRAN